MADKIWKMDAEIFIPGAASRLVTREQMQSLIDRKLEVISCGANVPFADNEIFFGPIGMYCDQHVSVIPDFIANCGMARVFAYLHQANAVITDQLIFADAAATIKNALQEVIQINKNKTGIASNAFEIALKKLM
jgi:glutamate dehydrogenase/leucine dehydrogenase